MNLVFPEIDPIIFSFNIGGFNLALRWYALAYILGILAAWKIMAVLSRKTWLWLNSKSPVTSETIENLMTYMVIGIVLGGRLGYVCFYQPIYFLNSPFEIIKVWNGGMSFHGGFLGVVIATIIFAVKNKIPILSIGDLVAIASPPGIFLGRLANFITGELWGRPTHSNWGILFPSKAAQTCPEDWVGICKRHPSQIYEAALEGLMLWVLMLACTFIFKSLHRSGELISIFLMGYGCSRIFVELFREPDLQFISASNPNGFVIHLNAQIGFSMGQILSLPMLLTGFTLFLLIRFVNSK